MTDIKYTQEDIDHIFAERVDLSIREGDLKGEMRNENDNRKRNV